MNRYKEKFHRAFLLLLVCGLLFGCKMRGCVPKGIYSVNQSNKPTPTPRDYSKMQCISVSAEDFSKLSEMSGYAFASKYNSKCVDVNGIVENWGSGEVRLSGYRQEEERDQLRLVAIRCHYDSPTEFNSLKVGERITVRGIVDRLDSTPTAPLLLNCISLK